MVFNHIRQFKKVRILDEDAKRNGIRRVWKVSKVRSDQEKQWTMTRTFLCNGCNRRFKRKKSGGHHAACTGAVWVENQAINGVNINERPVAQIIAARLENKI